LSSSGGKGGGFGDAPGHPINHPDLLKINFAALKRFPHRG